MKEARRAPLPIKIPDARAVKEYDRDGREEQERHVENHQVIEALVVTHEQQGELQETDENHQRIADVSCQAEEHLKLDAQGQGGGPDSSVKLYADLHHP